jgi:hypothetical protein
MQSSGPPPTFRYLVTGLGSLAKPAAWIVEQWFSTATWWGKVPWGYISLGFLLFFAGQLLADWRNRNSWLRSSWEHFRRLFDVEKIEYPPSKLDNLQCVLLQITLRFVKDIPNAKLLVHVFEDVKQRKARERFTWQEGPVTSLHRGEERTITFAVIARGGIKSGWGNKFNENHPIPPKVHNVVKIEVIGEQKRQTFSIFVIQAEAQTSEPLGVYVDQNDCDLFSVEDELRE